MSDLNLLFQYCPKLAVIDEDKVLLCRRAGEADLDGVFSFIGGKVERADDSTLKGIEREKTEEIGGDVRLRLLYTFNMAAEFTKADGSRMILPHYLAEYISGDVVLNDEYSEYMWVPIGELAEFGPKVGNIDTIVVELLRLHEIAKESDYVEI